MQGCYTGGFKLQLHMDSKAYRTLLINALWITQKLRIPYFLFRWKKGPICVSNDEELKGLWIWRNILYGKHGLTDQVTTNINERNIHAEYIKKKFPIQFATSENDAKSKLVNSVELINWKDYTHYLIILSNVKTQDLE